MSWFVVLAIILILAAVVLKLTLSQKQSQQGNEYPYKKLETLFSPAERSFFGVLNQAVGKHAQLFGKVRVADVIAPEKGMSRSDWQRSFNKISGKHFDFLLCAKSDLSILCAVELNDRSHNSKKRKARDAFLEGACRSANIPLIQITARATYSIKDVQETLMDFLPKNSLPSFPQENQEDVVDAQIEIDGKICSKCDSKMIKRIAKKGKNIGNEFWACSAFPKCRNIEEINEQ